MNGCFMLLVMCLWRFSCFPLYLAGNPKTTHVLPKRLTILICLFPLFISAQKVQPSGPISGQHSFALGDSVFLLDGKPFQIISGEMHYTRVPREAWRARMKMAKAMGLNTIGTYVFWNVQEPEKGLFDFRDNHDIRAFVKTAQE